MDDIKSAGLILCILMLLMTYLKQAVPRGKLNYLMKAVISVFILLSIINGFRHFDLQSLKALFDQSYTHSDEVWTRAADLVAEGLLREFEGYLQQEGLNAEVMEVVVEGNQESFEIQSVILSGTDAQTARSLLAGRYQIDETCIEVKNE